MHPRTIKRLPQLVALISGISIMAPAAALAQGSVTQLCTIIDNATTLIAVFGTIILIIAFIVLLYAAFLFITSGGNEETTKKARSLLIYSLIGLAVALLAIFADNIVQQLFGGTFLQGCPGASPFE